MSQPQWTNKSRQFKVTDTFSYMGAVLDNGGSAEHVNQRIRPAKNAHRLLQAAGLLAMGLDPFAAIHVYSFGVRHMPSNFQRLNYTPSTRHTRILSDGSWGCLNILYGVHNELVSIIKKRLMYNYCVLPALTLRCKDLDTDQTSTEQTCGDQNHIQCQKDQHLGQANDKSRRYNQQCEKNKMKCSWVGHINRL